MAAKKKQRARAPAPKPGSRKKSVGPRESRAQKKAPAALPRKSGRSAPSSSKAAPPARHVSSSSADPAQAAHWPIFTVLGEGASQKSSPAKLGIDSATLLRMYETMVLLRNLDAKMLLLQRQGRIGFWGPIKGQEAATIGSCAAFEDRDWILPALREAGAAIYRGFSLTEMVSQCLGNSGDKTLGRQMPCHYTFRAKNYVAMSSVIGTQIPHAVGVAMAAKIRKDPVVAAGYLGDGATSSTDYHAAMNFAAVYKAPVVIICQNNGWAISVPLCKQTATATIAQKAVAYGMEGVRVDGNDLLAVYLATKRAVEKARRGDGPTFLELLTYRVLGHSSSDDPTRYRDPKEVKYWEDRDPIERCRAYLERVGLWNAEKEEELDGALNARIATAIREAEAMPPVAAESLIQDVYHTSLSSQREMLARALEDL